MGSSMDTHAVLLLLDQCVPPGNLPYFLPNANSTRGQISKIVSNARGFTETPSGQQFQDVGPNSAFYAYIYRLVLHQVMSGYPCGTPPAGTCHPPNNLPILPAQQQRHERADIEDRVQHLLP